MNGLVYKRVKKNKIFIFNSLKNFLYSCANDLFLWRGCLRHHVIVVIALDFMAYSPRGELGNKSVSQRRTPD